MKRYPGSISTLFCLLFVSTLLQAEQPSRQIEVSGVGKVTQAPDMATTSFTFSQRSKVAAQAKKLIDTQVNNLLKLCQRLGIEDADIHAAKLTIYPEYDYKNNRELIGYRVGRDVQVKVRELQQYPRLLEGAVGIGATHSGNMTLDFSDREALEDKAMLKAFERAKQKARLLAKQADSRLGDAVWISETGSMPQPPMPMRMAAMAEAKGGSYPTGELELTKTVVVRFNLKD